MAGTSSLWRPEFVALLQHLAFASSGAQVAVDHLAQQPRLRAEPDRQTRARSRRKSGAIDFVDVEPEPVDVVAREPVTDGVEQVIADERCPSASFTSS